MGCSASLDRCRISYLHRDMISGLPACSVVAIPMTLSLPTFHIQLRHLNKKKHEWVISDQITRHKNVYFFLFCASMKLQGTQIKSVEDDPSITPGSVVRSPLSLVTIKDTEIFNASGSKTSPTVSSAVDTTIPPIPTLSLPTLSSSTWTFNPPVSTPSSFTR